jgi:hypothetical protein
MKHIFSKFARALVTLGPLVAATGTPLRAEIIYPFCKVGGGDVGTGVGYCNYASFEQCRISSAGYGMCVANPAYVPPAAAPAMRWRAKRG